MKWIRKLVGILLVILAIITALLLIATQVGWLVIAQHTFFGKILALGVTKATIFVAGTLTLGFIALPDSDRAKVSGSISKGVAAVAGTVTKAVGATTESIFSNLPWFPIIAALGGLYVWRNYVQ